MNEKRFRKLDAAAQRARPVRDRRRPDAPAGPDQLGQRRRRLPRGAAAGAGRGPARQAAGAAAALSRWPRTSIDDFFAAVRAGLVVEQSHQGQLYRSCACSSTCPPRSTSFWRAAAPNPFRAGRDRASGCAGHRAALQRAADARQPAPSAVSTNHDTANPSLAAKDFKSDLKPIWCPGCGDFGVLQAHLPRAGRRSAGRRTRSRSSPASAAPAASPATPPPTASTACTAARCPSRRASSWRNPDLLVLVAGGDGDGFSIGGGHVPHAIRRNIDLTYIVMDNQIYGLTKGQLSPTSPRGLHTVTSAVRQPRGSGEPAALRARLRRRLRRPGHARPTCRGSRR